MPRNRKETDSHGIMYLFGSGGGVGDDGFAVADGDALAGEPESAAPGRGAFQFMFQASP
jgi:hypothetical protein